MENYQVIIVGGGPAGSTLGCILLKQGVKTLIIDKRVFPRKKLCAGGLTPYAFELYDKHIGRENFSVADETYTTKLYFREEFVMEIKQDKPLRFVDRETFDNELLSRYSALGGQTVLGVRAQSFDTEKRTITLADGREFGYSVLVGADGANSAVRRLIDPNYRPDTFCIETSVPNANGAHEASIYCGEGGGYGWIFPHGENLSIGYGGSAQRAKRNADAFDGFLKLTGVDSEEVQPKICGAFIPMTPVSAPAKDGILLVGDAGGFVFPTTGEGLYYAAYTAENAAATITELLNGNLPYEQTESDYKARLAEIYRIDGDARDAIGRGKKGNFRRKFVAFCQNSKFIRNLAFKYCRKHPDLIAYAYEQVSSGKCFNPFKIRKDFINLKK